MIIPVTIKTIVEVVVTFRHPPTARYQDGHRQEAANTVTRVSTPLPMSLVRPGASHQPFGRAATSGKRDFLSSRNFRLSPMM